MDRILFPLMRNGIFLPRILAPSPVPTGPATMRPGYICQPWWVFTQKDATFSFSFSLSFFFFLLDAWPNLRMLFFWHLGLFCSFPKAPFPAMSAVMKQASLPEAQAAWYLSSLLHCPPLGNCWDLHMAFSVLLFFFLSDSNKIASWLLFESVLKCFYQWE